MPSILTESDLAAIAAYTGETTICEPGKACAPATSPLLDRESKRGKRAETRAYLGDEYRTFSEINRADATARASLGRYLRAQRLRTL